MIGSTANIVALGMLEKHSGKHMTFFRWLKVGLISTVVSGGIAVVAVLALERLMPDRFSAVSFEQLARLERQEREFVHKNVTLTGRVERTGSVSADPVAVRIVSVEPGHPGVIRGSLPARLAAGLTGAPYLIKGQLYTHADTRLLTVTSLEPLPAPPAK